MSDDDTTRGEEPTEPTEPQEPRPEPEPRRMSRPRDDRVFAGVCSGLGRYFNVDPVLFRVAAVALIFFGGAGILLYIAGVLLIPQEGEERPEHRRRRDRALAVIGVVLLVVAAGTLFSHSVFHAGWAFGPFVFIALAALAVWWLVSGERPQGDARSVARSIGRGIGMLIVCFALALGGAWLAGAGGGTVAAITVIVAGAILAGAALEGYGRWLILPVLSLALPVAFVSAANIDLHGGAGDKQYVPTSSAQVRDSYRLGAGRLVVDLRDAKLSPGDHPLKLRVGVGEAILLVPNNVCVATQSKVGMGVVDSFDRSNGGVDVDWSDQPPASPGNPRIVLNADVGVGRLGIGHYDEGYRGFRHRHGDYAFAGQVNTGCEVPSAH
ncbi:MAG TPA: PspC domain-containing protein [Thermoleophilaceae bacterium]|jgi:phage shock protein PspC (stress-responsive transcriptional regulator)